MAARPKKDYGTCSCGAKLKRYDKDICKDCFLAKVIKERQEKADIWAKGVCPVCGGGLVRNFSIGGWVQCEQLGAECFRKDPSKPSCNFQMFIYD